MGARSKKAKKKTSLMLAQLNDNGNEKESKIAMK